MSFGNVTLKISLLGGAIVTVRTFKWLFSSVNPLVANEVRFTVETFVAGQTNILGVRGVRGHFSRGEAF